MTFDSFLISLDQPRLYTCAWGRFRFFCDPNLAKSPSVYNLCRTTFVAHVLANGSRVDPQFARHKKGSGLLSTTVRRDGVEWNEAVENPFPGDRASNSKPISKRTWTSAYTWTGENYLLNRARLNNGITYGSYAYVYISGNRSFWTFTEPVKDGKPKKRRRATWTRPETKRALGPE